MISSLIKGGLRGVKNVNLQIRDAPKVVAINRNYKLCVAGCNKN
jgi:hypothetical protein